MIPQHQSLAGDRDTHRSRPWRGKQTCRQTECGVLPITLAWLRVNLVVCNDVQSFDAISRLGILRSKLQLFLLEQINASLKRHGLSS
eukprot:g31637.t1